jgi:murein DD-endopeptidase MepM/ murein hydrolase activator NlpD
MRYLFCSLLTVLVSFFAQSQFFNPVNYPKGYFRNPLAVPIDLSGNFGELRPNHYHMGLDLKTLKRENLPVYAAADGYIARIKIEPGGFGRAIYIFHPNGYTTLYAHLNDFSPALEAWVKQQQYQKESWAVGLDLTPDLFPVKKGDFIAMSGNTGGSQAPHLHFEIRRTSDDVNLNPMLFGFPLLDNTLPSILRMAVYDRSSGMYEQTPKIIPVKSIGAGRYGSAAALITVGSPKISLAITTYDTHTGSSNLNGIYQSTLYIDDKPTLAFRMNNISYNSTRYMNAHIDYKTKAGGGSFIQQLFELPGYISSIYSHDGKSGLIDLSDKQVHSIKIVVQDAYQNTSTLESKIQWNGMISAKPPIAGKLFYPLMLDGYETEDCEFYIGERCLYDSVHIRHSKLAATNPLAVSAIHAIGSPLVPLQESFLVRIKPNRSLSVTEKERTVMQWYSGSKSSVQKVDWQKDWAGAGFRDFGFYQLLVDTEPPQIVPVGFTDGADLSKAVRIVFTVKDNLDRFKNVRAELDGKWLRFTNDKSRNFIYRFDEKCLSGNHVLKITAEDEAGNRVERSWGFRR